MERTGTITAVSGDTLEVTFCRPGDCEKCHDAKYPRNFGRTELCQSIFLRQIF